MERAEIVLVRTLVERNLSLAIAESCTGGMASKRITDVPGSSQVFMGSIIPYDNKAKIDVLGVDGITLKIKGAVSKETAICMAAAVREKFGSKLGIGITGIAGPGGGTQEKPVGLVHIAISGSLIFHKKFLFDGSRSENRKQACDAAFTMLIKTLN